MVDDVLVDGYVILDIQVFHMIFDLQVDVFIVFYV